MKANPKQSDSATEGSNREISDREFSEEHGLKQTSVASTISFVFGLGALATVLLVYPSLVFAVLAILFGKVAKSNLKRSRGQWVGWGKARAGVLLGYVSLAISLMLLVYVSEVRMLVRGAIESERTTAFGAQHRFNRGGLGEIEGQLAAGEVIEFGNTAVGRRLAAEFRRELRKSLNQVLTRRGDRGIGLETSGISCYGHVSDGVCFIAAIPEMDRYDAAADSILKKVAWQSAVVVLGAAEFEPADAPLAVGLMGSNGCQVVLWSSNWSGFTDVPAPDSVENDCAKIVALMQ